MEDHEARSTAIEQLEAFRLSSYAARTFVGLTILGEATAKEVSEAVDVPRTRVYDAATELERRDLVRVTHSKPRRFSAVEAERTARRFELEYAQRIERLLAALSAL